MRFYCKECRQELESQHFMAGFKVTCPRCGEKTVLLYEDGQPVKHYFYDVGFSDFRQLLGSCSTNPDKDLRVRRIVEGFLECSMHVENREATLIAEDNSLFPLEVAHILIQTDKAVQFGLYQAAQDVWK